MQVNKLEDLVPYQRSLLELWGREEFQPVMGLLNRLKEEAISWARYDAVNETAEKVKATSAKISTQLRLVEMLIELPERLKVVAKIAERQKAQGMRLVNTVEGGEL